ncbi:MAG: hypothetical protein QM753_20545 [Thermomicrobiales bacterium]
MLALKDLRQDLGSEDPAVWLRARGDPMHYERQLPDPPPADPDLEADAESWRIFTSSVIDVGTWRNPSRTVDNAHGIAMCLDQNGDVVGWGEASPKGTIHGRSESDFRFDLWTGNHEMCEDFVIVGQAAGWGR